MNTYEHLKKAPKGAEQQPTDWHPADVVAALRKAGWSLRKLSAQHGYSPNAIKHANVRPYPKAERLIAHAIGVEPWDIWPSRYDAEHQPLSGHGARQRAGQGRHLGKLTPNPASSNVSS